MAQFNRAKREVALKIVYYGPGLAGKTTNLVRLHDHYPARAKGELVQLDTEQERTLFFDYFPGVLGKIRGYDIRVDYFTVPGQSYYNITRRTVLSGADGVVFVADSDPRREQANVTAHANLIENLAYFGVASAELPIVYQWNKRDVAGALPTRVLEQALNTRGAPSFDAVATEGVGVRETERAVLNSVLRTMRPTPAQEEA